MRFALTEDQAAIRDAVRELLARECPPELVRAAWPGGDPERVDRLWSRLAELGLPGAAVPEPAGGLGLDESGLVPLLIELGYAAVPLPAAETTAVAGPLLAAAGDARLATLVGGGARVALVGPGGFTPYGQRADLLLELTPDRATLAEPPTAAEPVPTVDGSRAAVRVPELAGTVVTTDRALLALTADRAALATAAQLVGLGRRLCDRTVSYVRERRQFGSPVGSFQAVQHRLANLALRLALAEPAVHAAGWCLAQQAPGPDVAAAALLAAEAATLAARTAIQCHGAIGYTVEYDLHLYAKRVWAMAAADRGIDHHVARVAAALDLPEGVNS